MGPPRIANGLRGSYGLSSSAPARRDTYIDLIPRWVIIMFGLFADMKPGFSRRVWWHKIAANRESVESTRGRESASHAQSSVTVLPWVMPAG
jgi:hypothetical protein